MKLIGPVSITSSEIAATNITDESAWNSGTTYAEDDSVAYNDTLYISLQNGNTNNQPDTSPAWWANAGALATVRPFDGIIDNGVTNSGTVEYTLQPGAFVTGIAFFGLQGTTLDVTVTDSGEGVVYAETIQLQDNSAITSWYTYFFSPIVQKTEVVLTDLPPYLGADVDFTVDAGAGTAGVGEVVLGLVDQIGITNTGTAITIRDYSRKDTNDFGKTVLTERRYAALVEYNVTIESVNDQFVRQKLISRRATATVFIGDENHPDTIVYGFPRDWDYVKEFSIENLTLRVEGFV